MDQALFMRFNRLTSSIDIIVKPMRLWKKAFQLWDAGQVSHHGAYSLARFSRLHEYFQKATWYRVLLILVFAAAPPLAVMMIIDSIPLQDPRHGWQANWAFWLRCALTVSAQTFATVLQFHVTAPAATLTIMKCILIACTVAIGYSFSVMGIASIWGFPIPFQIITCVPAWHLWLIGSMIFTLGRSQLVSNMDLRRQTKRYLDIVHAQAPLLMVYPGYSAIFMRLSKPNQTAFIFALPVVKFVLKNALS